jgi:hypothetical protein
MPEHHDTNPQADADERQPWMMRRGQNIIQLCDELALCMASADVCGVLRVLTRSIETWAVALKQSVLEHFSDSSDAELARSLSPPGSMLVPGFVGEPFVGASESIDLVELAIGSAQAQSLAHRLAELEQKRSWFAGQMAEVAYSWNDERDLESLVVIDEYRKNLKHAAWDVCRFINSLLSLIEQQRIRIPLAITPPGKDQEQEDESVSLNKKCSHSTDFTSVNWFGTQYSFTKGQQAEAVRVLWTAWENGGHSLSQETISGIIKSDDNRFQLRKVFRQKGGDAKGQQHPAWGTMIKEASKGVYMLAKPTQPES